MLSAKREVAALQAELAAAEIAAQEKQLAVTIKVAALQTELAAKCAAGQLLTEVAALEQQLAAARQLERQLAEEVAALEKVMTSSSSPLVPYLPESESQSSSASPSALSIRLPSLRSRQHKSLLARVSKDAPAISL